MNVTIYVNGKRVTKEELSKIEIHNETIKKIFAEKLAEMCKGEEEWQNLIQK